MVLATIGFLFAQATAVPSPVPSSFAGVTLGETEQALVAQMGEPVMRNTADSGAIQYAYVGPGNTLEFVRIERGNVVAVAIKPSPWRDDLGGTPPSAMGISLGDSPAKLIQLGKERFVSGSKNGDDVTGVYKGDDGLQYAYTIGDGKIAQILVRLDPAKSKELPQNSEPEPILHGGTSFEDAIVLKAPTEAVGVKSEYAFLAVHPCTNGGRWQSKHQALQQHAGQPYDVLTEACPADNTQRDFYFNIAGYFGKM